MRSPMLCGFCLLLMGATISAQDPPVLTLTQAVKEALVKNERMLNQHDSIDQANLGVRLARNAFTPKVVPNVLGSFGQTDINSQNYRVDVSQKFTTGTELRAGVGTSTAQIPGLAGVPAADLEPAAAARIRIERRPPGADERGAAPQRRRPPADARRTAGDG